MANTLTRFLAISFVDILVIELTSHNATVQSLAPDINLFPSK